MNERTDASRRLGPVPHLGTEQVALPDDQHCEYL